MKLEKCDNLKKYIGGDVSGGGIRVKNEHVFAVHSRVLMKTHLNQAISYVKLLLKLTEC